MMEVKSGKKRRWKSVRRGRLKGGGEDARLVRMRIEDLGLTTSCRVLLLLVLD